MYVRNHSRYFLKPVVSSVYGFILAAVFNIVVMHSCQLSGQLPYILIIDIDIHVYMIDTLF